MFDFYADLLGGRTFECVEDFNAEVMHITAELEEELGRAERSILTHAPDVLEDLDVVVAGLDDGETED